MLLLQLRPVCGRRVLLAVLPRRTARWSGLGVVGGEWVVVCVLVRGGGALLLALQRLGVRRALGGHELHGVGEDVGQVEGSRRHAVLAWATLRRLNGRDEGRVIAARGAWSIVHVVRRAGVEERWWNGQSYVVALTAANWRAGRHCCCVLSRPVDVCE